MILPTPPAFGESTLPMTGRDGQAVKLSFRPGRGQRAL
jgi:hypothetical protein